MAKVESLEIWKRLCGGSVEMELHIFKNSSTGVAHFQE